MPRSVRRWREWSVLAAPSDPLAYVGGVDIEFYETPGPLTELTHDQSETIQGLDLGPRSLCLVAQSLLISPPDAANAGLSDERMAESNIRPARALLERAHELDETTPLGQPRPADHRVVGTCRHFAVLATALLRAKSVPARARCGFATYFIPPKKVDHWIVEFWSHDTARWVRIDPEHLDRPTPVSVQMDNLSPGEFLTAGEAWQIVRSGDEVGSDFGVFGTENWGPGEIRGNAMRDLASVLHKIEMLPWDVWGPMEDSYDGKTGEDFDKLIDDLAIATQDGDVAEMTRVYEQLAIPDSMIS